MSSLAGESDTKRDALERFKTSPAVKASAVDRWDGVFSDTTRAIQKLIAWILREIRRHQSPVRTLP